MTLTIDEVLNELISEVGGDTTDAAFKTKMLGFMKAGIRHIPVFMRSRLFLTLGTSTLSAGDFSIDLSALNPGFIKERAVWWVTSESKRELIWQPNSNRQFNDIFSPNASGNPRVYRIYNKTMEFNRKADKEYTIGIEYFKEVSAVAVDDTFFGDDSLLEAVKHFTKMVYFGDYEKDRQSKADHQRDGEKIIFELKADYEVQEMGGYVEGSNSTIGGF